MFTNKSILFAVLMMLAVSLAATEVLAEDIAETDKTEKAITPQKQTELIDIVRNATVTVQYKLKYDKGQSPEVYNDCFYFYGGDRYRQMPGVSSADPLTCVEQQRSFDVAGIAISSTEILVPDLMIHSRFIEGITVKFGDAIIEAHQDSVCSDRPAIIIKTDSEIPRIKPIVFDADTEDKKLFAAFVAERAGQWAFGVSPWSESVTFGYKGAMLKAPSIPSLLIREDGVVVGACFRPYLEMDGSWKGSPKSWPFVSVQRLDELKQSVRKIFSDSILRVRLGLRSPREDQSSQRYYGRSSDSEATEMHLLGAVLDDKRILVAADMPPKVTARLETITVYPVGSEPVEAKFVSSYKDYGCFIAELPKPVGTPVKLSDSVIADLMKDMLIGVEVAVQGESMDIKMLHRRIADQTRAFEGNLAPILESPESELLLYDVDGSLVALPAMRRDKSPDEYGYRDYDRDEFMAAAELEKIIYGEDLSEHFDQSNVPLVEAQELRLAWLGVELQPLDQELARINKVSALTDDGDFGCRVAYVYDDSPAAMAGLQMGDVLISLHSDKWPQPVNVTLDRYAGSNYSMRLWAQLDSIPEEYFQRLPRPWPAVENSVTRAITDLGFGEKFVLEYARDGQQLTHEFTVEQSPAHYDSAAKYKDESLGLTVRDLSYEVRRYFQRTEKDGGVIVSKVEPGSRASVSGVRHYEIITHVNNQPVMNTKQFSQLVSAGGELTFQIKRMTKGRVVSIRSLDSATE